LHHREPGVLGAILYSDNIIAELIADTIHVHPIAMKVLIHYLGTDRIVLITDAMAGAGLSDGTYELAGHNVIVKNGCATLANSTLSGSTVTLNNCIYNIKQKVSISLNESVKMV